MKKKCKKCDMVRSEKDLVRFNDGTYMCFSCWNIYSKKKESTNPN